MSGWDLTDWKEPGPPIVISVETEKNRGLYTDTFLATQLQHHTLESKNKKKEKKKQTWWATDDENLLIQPFPLSVFRPRRPVLVTWAFPVLCFICTFWCFNSKNILWWKNVITSCIFKQINTNSAVTAFNCPNYCNSGSASLHVKHAQEKKKKSPVLFFLPFPGHYLNRGS